LRSPLQIWQRRDALRTRSNVPRQQ